MLSGTVDFLGADRLSALGPCPVLIVDAAGWTPPAPDVQAVIIGIDRHASLPDVDPTGFDILLTERADPPAPWVAVPPGRSGQEADRIARAIASRPFASTILCRVLRTNENLPFAQALEVESLAYSTLLTGGEFARWRAGRRAAPAITASGPLVIVERHDDRVTLTLNHPQARNPMTAAMRDALYEALANCLDDPTSPSVELRGAGRCFSAGGDLGEFGTARDLAEAHAIRTVRNCAALLHRLGARARVRLHGACIGSGLEIPAAAQFRIATPDNWFQLPELGMGLIPGAGGTVSIARAIGRHRTGWLALSGKRIGARIALQWGLIHEIAA